MRIIKIGYKRKSKKRIIKLKYKFKKRRYLIKYYLTRAEDKLLVLRKYSNSPTPFCNCCTENDLRFLTIDHINNDGHKFQKRMTYRDLIINKFPNYPALQVLC